VSTQPTVQRKPRPLSPVVKRLGSKVDHLPLSSAEVNNLSFLVLPSSTYMLTVGVEGFCDFSFDHTQAHATGGRTPLDEGSARRRDLYLTIQTLYKTNIHAPDGIRTHDPSKRSAADLRLRPRWHWDRRGG
jgi:hypothetical protein